VALTLDTDGVVLARRGHPLAIVDSIAAKVVDPTGAGDAFAAGFLAEWVLTGNELASVAAGVATGALAVSTIGARPTA
jgi:sugar/nucleoside kinase (ribokinase family)